MQNSEFSNNEKDFSIYDNCKKVTLSNYTTERTVDRQGRISPEGEWNPGDFSVGTNDPFLKKILEAGLAVYKRHNELAITDFDINSGILIRMYEEYIEIVCISTKENLRKQGHGTNLMKILTAVADANNTVLKLSIESIERSTTLPTHPIIVDGAKGKNRLLVKELQIWFAKFGFEKDRHPKEKKGYPMKRMPINL